MPDAKVGDLIFIDTNNDGVINDDDKTFAGSYTPKKHLLVRRLAQLERL